MKGQLRRQKEVEEEKKHDRVKHNHIYARPDKTLRLTENPEGQRLPQAQGRHRQSR